ncbi:MAG: hypothetical protein ACE5HE_09090 [Phycisphaerae bacterium]
MIVYVRAEDYSSAGTVDASGGIGAEALGQVNPIETSFTSLLVDAQELTVQPGQLESCCAGQKAHGLPTHL